MELSLRELGERETYHLMTQVLIPRPIAWVLTDNGAGPRERWNLAPFSYFNGVCSDPAMVMFSIGNGIAGRIKDTYRNLAAGTPFTIALPHRELMEVVQATAIDLEPGVSEVTRSQLALVAWDWPVPRVGDARANLGCTLDRFVALAAGRQQVAFAIVERLWVDDRAVHVDEGRSRTTIDPAVLDPLARLGGGAYAGLTAPRVPERRGRSVDGSSPTA